MPIPAASAAGATKGSIVPLWWAQQGGSSAVTNFNNIPLGYQDLMIVTNGFYTGPTGNAAINADNWTVNNIALTGSPLSNNGLYSWSSSVQTYGNYTGGLINLNPQAVAINQPFSIIIHVLNYASTTNYKTVLVESAVDKGDSSTGVSYIGSGTVQTLGAITGFNISTYNGNFVWSSTSVQAVYGIRGPKQ